ncbi:MAG TPA: hypothetical protein VFL80_07615, partial [Thermoanaerobaculia bacterium]|nr:hypothetical protein [Thermoanaerobaculia bacterium]
MAFRNLRRAGVLATIAAGFLLWHFPLLTPDGRVRGFNSDAAILGLMGKKILEGRGFDVFFWGQNYIGPLTSMITAAWGSITGGANPLALRLATLTEAILGTFFLWMGIARIDVRAAATAAVALVLTPPVLLRMMITPLGAEMAFLMSAALFAVLMQHLTVEEGRGWLSRPGGQIAFGALAGLSWWMNQQVVFTLIAGILVLGLQSAVGRRFWSALRLRDRLLLRAGPLGWRSLPGVVEAMAWVLTTVGAVLLFAYFVLDLAGLPQRPFVVGRAADGIILFLLPHLLLPVLFGEWRGWRWQASAEEKSEVAAAIRFTAGAAIGYAPVWLGAMAGWYERSYVFGFRPIYPSELPAQIRSLIEVVPHWIGMIRNPVGGVYAVAMAVFVVAALRATRTRARLLVAA